MTDKELDNYMKTVNPNFNSHIGKGTIEMSKEYYNLLEEKMARLINENQELKEQNKKEFADYIKFKKEQYDEYLEKVNKLIKEKQELKKKHEITKKIARDWAAECTLLFNHNKEMKVYKEVLQKYKEIIGDDK